MQVTDTPVGQRFVTLPEGANAAEIDEYLSEAKESKLEAYFTWNSSNPLSAAASTSCHTFHLQDMTPSVQLSQNS